MSTGPPVIVVGASAGGVDALKTVVAGLPAELPAAVLVVLHLAPGGPSVLPRILDRYTDLTVVVAEDGQTVCSGTVYVCPPNHHLELDGPVLRLTTHPPEGHHRPSIDRLFRSAAANGAAQAVGVVLSGCLHDGAAGLAALVAAGGSAVVQDPRTAEYPDMPASALVAVPSAESVPLHEVAATLVRLCTCRSVVGSG
jgi:two-component system chemotaxis response regulator CheB